MQVHRPLLAAVMLLALAGHANAQTAGGTTGPAGSSLGATPSPGTLFPQDDSTAIGGSFASPPPFTTGLSQPAPILVPPIAGVPNTTTPGMIGTGATPSGLPGDDPLNPGFPAPLNLQHQAQP